MVAHLVTLKLRLLRNGLRRSPWQVVALVVGALYGLVVCLLAVAGLVVLRTVDAGTAGVAVALGGSALVLGWAVVPLVAFGADATLDPARLVLFPLPPRRLVVGLLAAGAVGVPGAVTAVLALATVVTWSRGPGTAAVALVAAAIGFATCVAASRTTTTALAGLLAGRRSREAGAVVFVVVAVLLGPSLSVVGRSGVDLRSLAALARVLGWTPLGLAWTAPAEVAAGRPGAGLLKLALAAVSCALLLAAWAAALARAMVTPASSTAGRRTAAAAAAVPSGRVPSGRSAGGSPVARLLRRVEAAGPAGAVTARCLRYWRRDTRYLISLVAVVALPVVFVLVSAQAPGSARVQGLAVPVVLAAALGWLGHNDVAYDGTALWLHVSAGLPGRSDRLGRAAALLAWAVPLVVVAAVVGVALAGEWRLLPAELGAVLSLLGAGAGVCAVASALAPYPVADPGASPFGARQGASLAAFASQLVTSGLTVVLSLPVLALGVTALLVTSPLLWGLASAAALAAGITTGALCLVLGVRQGGALLDRRAPELLAQLAR